MLYLRDNKIVILRSANKIEGTHIFVPTSADCYKFADGKFYINSIIGGLTPSDIEKVSKLGLPANKVTVSYSCSFMIDKSGNTWTTTVYSNSDSGEISFDISKVPNHLPYVYISQKAILSDLDRMVMAYLEAGMSDEFIMHDVENTVNCTSIKPIVLDVENIIKILNGELPEDKTYYVKTYTTTTDSTSPVTNEKQDSETVE